MTSPPHSKIFSISTVDTSSRKLYHDEPELLADSSGTKPLSEQVEAVLECPVRKVSIEELEASVDVACTKTAKDRALDTSLEASLKMSTEESFVDPVSRKISQDRYEVPVDVSVRKGANEFDAEFSSRKVEKDITGNLMEKHLRNVYRERSDLPLDVRKLLWNESQAKPNVPPRRISRDMMGVSVDSASRKLARDDADKFESRRITRDSMGMSQDTGSRKLPWNKGDFQLDCSIRGLPKDKMVDTSRTPPRKLSRDELEYVTDTASMKMPPREKLEAHMDTSSPPDRHTFVFEPSTSRRIQRNELEKSAGSLRRRIQRMPRDDVDASIDTLTGKITWDRVDVPAEMTKQAILREELAASESGSYPGWIGQPDLMLTSQVPWKSSSDLYTVGPLSQLVYDGILEKSCESVATTPTGLSASTPNLPHSRLLTEVEPPSRVVFASSLASSESGEEKNKEKEKTKKSLKLKNPFKRKNESTPEKSQSSPQKL